jgi:thioredoxin reductase (NADPH)
MNTENVSCLIIGSGPAGYTAAIYAARAGLKPVLYTGIQPGGQLTTTTEVENYPGYPEGVQGPQMMLDFEAQARRFDTDIRYGIATKVDFSESGLHTVWIDGQQQIQSSAVIIATGASAKWLGLESEQRLNGHGVSACAVCDGFFFRGQDVIVVGGGDTACEEASYLAKLCRKVYLLVRKDTLRASQIMQTRVESIPNLEILWNTQTEEILGDHAVVGARIVNNKTGESKTIEATGFFVAIGHQPNTDIFKGFLDMDEVGYIQTQKGTAKTNIEGVFACGDAQDNIYRQAVTAAGTGCMAALDAERYLAEKELH